jgi:hypothetical protein
MQHELKDKTEKLVVLDAEKRELLVKLQEQEHNFKDLKIAEAEKNSELSVLRIRKEKLTAERVREYEIINLRMYYGLKLRKQRLKLIWS